MEQRKELILETIIKEHIKTGTPVGSGVLVDKYKLNISPATVRNEMAELEEAGLIHQPHTSAGRVPTEAAYRLYVEKLTEKKLSESDGGTLRDSVVEQDEQGLKQAAKVIAALSNNAVFWAFHRHNVYYTGIANLLAQPEFTQSEMMYDISALIDRLDVILDKVFDDIEVGATVSIGSDNPFSDLCSVVITKYRTKDNTGVMGILGPIRMNYEKNLALVKFVHELLNIK